MNFLCSCALGAVSGSQRCILIMLGWTLCFAFFQDNEKYNIWSAVRNSSRALYSFISATFLKFDWWKTVNVLIMRNAINSTLSMFIKAPKRGFCQIIFVLVSKWFFCDHLFKMILVSVQNTERTLTNSGGIIRLTPSLETRSSSQKRRGKGRSGQPKINKVPWNYQTL